MIYEIRVSCGSATELHIIYEEHDADNEDQDIRNLGGPNRKILSRIACTVSAEI